MTIIFFYSNSKLVLNTIIESHRKFNCSHYLCANTWTIIFDLAIINHFIDGERMNINFLLTRKVEI